MRIAFVVSGVDKMESLERTLLEICSRSVYLFVVQLNPASDKMSFFLNHVDLVHLVKQKGVATSATPTTNSVNHVS